MLDNSDQTCQENLGCVESRKKIRGRHNKMKREAKKSLRLGDITKAEEIGETIEKEQIERTAFFKIKNLIRNVLSIEELDKIAYETGFKTRKREMTTYACVVVLMTGCLEQTANTLNVMCGYLRKWFGIFIKPQSLSEMLNRDCAKLFFKRIMENIIVYESNKLMKLFTSNFKLKELFPRIILQDSTVISLPDNMWRLFRGCGGAASKAAMKIDIIFDLVENRVLKATFVSGRVPDAKLSKGILDVVGEGDLIIRDLGYFNLKHFSRLMENNFFISRLSINTNVYLNPEDENPVDLVDHFKKLNIQEESEMLLYIGKKERIPTRLIVIKVPPEVLESRRQQYKRSNGYSKNPSEELQEWNGFTFMITNIKKEKMSLKLTVLIYKIRWQIELFFKNMKSNLNIDVISGKNKNRILSSIYIKISFLWITTMLYAYSQIVAGEDKEVSFYKFTRWVKITLDIKYLIISGDISDFIIEIEENIDLFCKQRNRKRTTTNKMIEDVHKLDANRNFRPNTTHDQKLKNSEENQVSNAA